MNIADEQFADIQMLRYELKGFDKLTLRQKLLVYNLSEATLAGRDITTDQFGRYNLVIRKSLEILYVNFTGDKSSVDFLQMELYLKRLWFSNGIYHHYSSSKFIPGFTDTFFKLEVAKNEKEILKATGYSDMKAYYTDILPIIFDSSVLPWRVNKSRGDDIVATSGCNYYENVTQQEVEDFYKQQKVKDSDHPVSYGLNTKILKQNGRIIEEVWNSEGKYGVPIKKIISHLQAAKSYAENSQQAKVIEQLIGFYVLGDLQIFDDYSVEWVKDKNSKVDFINGFIEVYGDPLGLKGSWEGIVHYVDEESTHRTELISHNAQWFEDHSPVAPRFKKEKVCGVSATVVCAAMLGGDEYPSTAIGINLPNSDWIRAEHGSKSITISNLIDAYNRAARGNGVREEFVCDKEVLHQISLWGDLCDDLHTDLHECVGHGSGRLLPGVDSDALKSYADTIEEARADLFALYFIADPQLVTWGLTPNAQAYQSQYYTYLLNGLLIQLARIEQGKNIEEAHMRNRAMISRWVLSHSSHCVELVKENGKTFLRVHDFTKLRELFGELLAEVQRIKSEGDYEAAHDLVENYAVQIDANLHSEVITRYSKLNVKPYKGFINPRLIPIRDSSGNIIDIEVDYSESYTHQMLRYSSEYGFL